MADLIIHGVPNGHDVSTCDKNTRDFFGLFYDASNGVKTNVTRRVNNDVVYSYLVYGNQDKNSQIIMVVRGLILECLWCFTINMRQIPNLFLIY